ncbi:hypothetical protein GA0115234_1133101 [Streptomyces sp. DvalAA-43]|nr:hypothetical protein GA0115234_1133101 [Streptomyces sp. DvalAA-43]
MNARRRASMAPSSAAVRPWSAPDRSRTSAASSPSASRKTSMQSRWSAARRGPPRAARMRWASAGFVRTSTRCARPRPSVISTRARVNSMMASSSSSPGPSPRTTSVTPPGAQFLAAPPGGGCPSPADRRCSSPSRNSPCHGPSWRRRHCAPPAMPERCATASSSRRTRSGMPGAHRRTCSPCCPEARPRPPRSTCPVMPSPCPGPPTRNCGSPSRPGPEPRRAGSPSSTSSTPPPTGGPAPQAPWSSSAPARRT